MNLEFIRIKNYYLNLSEVLSLCLKNIFKTVNWTFEEKYFFSRYCTVDNPKLIHGLVLSFYSDNEEFYHQDHNAVHRSINYTDNHSFSYFVSLLLDITLDCVLRNPVNLAKMSLFAFITPIFQLYNRSLCTVIGISPSRSARV